MITNPSAGVDNITTQAGRLHEREVIMIWSEFSFPVLVGIVVVVVAVSLSALALLVRRVNRRGRR